MTNRRSFFKLLGLAAGAVTVAGRADPPAAQPPLTPQVKSKKATVTTMMSDGQWHVVKHGFKTPFVLAVVGTKTGSLPAEVQIVDLDTSKVRFTQPSTSWFSWRKPAPGPVTVVIYEPIQQPKIPRAEMGALLKTDEFPGNRPPITPGNTNGNRPVVPPGWQNYGSP